MCAVECALFFAVHAGHNFWLARTPQFWLVMSPPPGQWIPIPELSDEFDCAGPEPTLRYRDEHASFETPDHGCTIDTNKWRGVDTWLGQPWTWMPPNSAGANIWQGALALTLTYDEHSRPA